MSGGVAVSEDAGDLLDALLERADTALYGAKANGRNCVQRADEPKTNGGRPNVVRVA